MGDQAIYNTEKQLQEHKEKIPQNIHDQINGDITSLNEAVTTEDPEKIKEALERLRTLPWKLVRLSTPKLALIKVNNSKRSNHHNRKNSNRRLSKKKKKREE